MKQRPLRLLLREVQVPLDVVELRWLVVVVRVQRRLVVSKARQALRKVGLHRRTREAESAKYLCFCEV